MMAPPILRAGIRHTMVVLNTVPTEHSRLIRGTISKASWPLYVRLYPLLSTTPIRYRDHAQTCGEWRITGQPIHRSPSAPERAPAYSAGDVLGSDGDHMRGTVAQQQTEGDLCRELAGDGLSGILSCWCWHRAPQLVVGLSSGSFAGRSTGGVW